MVERFLHYMSFETYLGILKGKSGSRSTTGGSRRRIVVLEEVTGENLRKCSVRGARLGMN